MAFAEHAAKPKTEAKTAANHRSATNLAEKSATKPDITRQIYIQLGAFSSRINAEQMVSKTAQARIDKMGIAKIQAVTSNSKMIYRVRLGPFNNETTAAQVVQQLIQNKIGEPRIFHDS